MEVAERPVDVRFATTGVKRRTEYMTLNMKILEERQEGQRETIFGLFMDHSLTKEKSAATLGLSLEEFEEAYDNWASKSTLPD